MQRKSPLPFAGPKFTGAFQISYARSAIEICSLLQCLAKAANYLFRSGSMPGIRSTAKDSETERISEKAIIAVRVELSSG
ncbi:hypothetical protein CEXT_218301 [Caerostris extrusa]|uniref:Uncharacterized protein n=1 Tax=Caerostris extrusa TaxID=172846 RepID=A0AAV4UJG1_CAEEX|nr:hypothetical protein CEXT_218301 [Caerostris extrusa]